MWITVALIKQKTKSYIYRHWKIVCKVNFRKKKKKQVKMELRSPNQHMLRAVTSKLCQTKGIPRNRSEMHTLGASLVVPW